MSYDEDDATTLQGASQAKRSRKTKIRRRTESSETETEDGEDVSYECNNSKIARLARHLLYATSNNLCFLVTDKFLQNLLKCIEYNQLPKEKDGALKDAVAQKLHYFSKTEYPYALRQANSAIEQSFGCKIIHRSNQSHLVRMENADDSYFCDPMAQAKKGLLSAILMFIFASKSAKTNANAITEAALLNFLKSLGLSYSTPDPIFGDINKFISPTPSAEFIHDGYISFTKSSDRCESQVIMYDWGPRATLVCEPTVLLDSFCKIMKDPQVDKWSSQVDTMKQLEEEKKQILKNSEQYVHSNT